MASKLAQYQKHRMAENYLVIWVDGNIDMANQDCQNTMEQLRAVVNQVTPCETAEQCIQQLTENQEEISFVISSGAIGQHLVPDIHDMAKLNAIFIFCGNKQRHQVWAQNWPKIKGVHTTIKHICDKLATAIKQYNQDHMSEILLEIKHEQQAVQDLVIYCQEQYQGNKKEIKIIKEFQRTYQASNAIWCTNPDVSLVFAKEALKMTDMVGILFQITIDPTASSTPFASIQEVSYYKEEEEILFTMHTVFRIGEVRKIDNNRALYQADLKLTSDDDPQLQELTDFIRKEVSGTRWRRMGQLLFKIGQFDKAEELYLALLEQPSDHSDRAHIYHQLGVMKYSQGQYEEAVAFYEQSLKIEQKTLPKDDPSLAPTYNNIAAVYNNMGDYSKALEFYEKSHEIYEKALPTNHPDLAKSYNNIGQVYNNLGDYSKALEIYEKDLQIRKKALPPTHPDLAISYTTIGQVYNNMGDYSKALEFYEKSLKIKEKSLPPNHPRFGNSYSNIGQVYNNMGDYSKALEFYEKDLEIIQKALPANHPSLATSYSNIGGVYSDMGDYSKALEFYEKSLEIKEKSLPPNHSR
ncbi:unnamed protein product, partial [Rotaria sp. Silwood1]